MLHFDSFDLSRSILDALAKQGYETPTPIQSEAIPPALAGRDVLGCAQTGTGKTAAFAIPILNRLHTVKAKAGRGRPRALVLSPTRELASQIGENFAAYGKHTHIRGVTIYGGVSQHHQARRLREGVDIVVATPGRLIDLMDQGLVDLSGIEVFVLDEADRMLDMGFINPIRRISAALPAVRQTMLFSATMPKSIAALADSLLSNPVRVSVTPVASAAPLIEQSVHMVEHHDKATLLESLLSCRTVARALVFTRTKHGADKLTHKLARAGVTAEAIHGNKNQNQRQRALDSFRSGQARVLVATDVAARGIDIDGVTHVFNFNLPNEPEAYVHRIGRTGRAGATGVAVSFCASDEKAHLRSIERLTGSRLKRERGATENGGEPTPAAPAPTPHTEQGLAGVRTPGSKHSPDHAPRPGPKPRAGQAGNRPAARGRNTARPGRGVTRTGSA